jgi:hypothetical protein
MLASDIMTVISNVSLTGEKADSSNVMPVTTEWSNKTVNAAGGVFASVRKTMLFLAQAALVFILLTSTGMATMPPGPDDDLEDAPVCKMLVSNRAAASAQHHYEESRPNPTVTASCPFVSQQASARTTADRSPLVIPLRT